MREIRKALGAAIANALIQAGVIVTSAPARITAPEWLGLASVVVTPFVVYVLRNDPSSPPPPAA